MAEINYVHCQMAPVPQDFLDQLAPELYDRIDDTTILIKEGIRIILCSQPPNEEKIVETWMQLKELKESSSGT